MDARIGETHPKAQIAVIPSNKCQLCKKNKTQWNCFTCEEFMCNHCKLAHLNSKASRNHKVGTMYGAESIDHIHKYCKVHPEEEVIFFCQTCEIFICKICITGESHKTHKTKTKEKIIEEQAKEVSKIIDKLSENVSSLDTTIVAVKKMQSDYSGYSAKCISMVKDSYANLKTKLDELLVDDIEKIKRNEKLVEKKLNEKETQLEDSKEQLRKLIEKCEEKHEQRSMELVKFAKDAKITQTKLTENIYLPIPPDPPKFVTNRDVHKLTVIFGELQVRDEKEIDRNLNYTRFAETKSMHSTASMNKLTNYKSTTSDTTHDPVKVLSSFDMENKDRVAALRDDRAWFWESGQDELTLVASNGRVLQTETVLIFRDMAVNKMGQLFFIKWDGRWLGKLTADGDYNHCYKPVEIYRNEEASTCMQIITITDDNNIILGLHDYGMNTNKIYKLEISSLRMSVIHNGKRSWFKAPLFNGDLKSVSQNINGDIVVAHTGEVTVVDKDKQKRFSYGGSPDDLGRPFNPCDTVTDKHGHIYISDGNNAVIHILDMNGHFVKHIMLKHINGMSIDYKGNLWVCCNAEGMVLILKPFPSLDNV